MKKSESKKKSAYLINVAQKARKTAQILLKS